MAEKSKKIVPFTRGTDPEFFLRNKDRFISAIPHVEGTKYEPAPLPSGGTIQRDNVALEFATAPADSSEDFVEKIRGCLKDAIARVPEGCELVVTPSATFDADELDHPEAQEFGCDPDFNAWTMGDNEKPWCGDSGFRSCGAHIHVGGIDEDGNWKPGLEFLGNLEGKVNLVRAMDICHGMVSCVLDNSEAAIKRRELYGKAGAFRYPPYGIEYRVLSNYWMKSPELVMLMDALTAEAIKLVQAGKLFDLIEELGAEDIQGIINQGRREDAAKVVDQYLRPLFDETTLDLLDMCMEKIDTYGDLRAEWGLS